MAKSGDKPACLLDAPIRIRDVGTGGPDADDDIDWPMQQLEAKIRDLDRQIAESEAHIEALCERRDEELAHCQAMVRDVAEAVAADPKFGKDSDFYRELQAALDASPNPPPGRSAGRGKGS